MDVRIIRFYWLIIAALSILLLTIAGLVLADIFVRSTQPELIIGLVVILGVSVLIILLFIMASGFAILGLHDSRQAMGLPEGSIRAMIALLLIIIWVIFSIYLFNAVQNQPASANSAQVLQLSQQLFTTMGTLVVAISAFYFGSTNLTAVRSALTPSIPAERPAIQSINPVVGEQGQELELTITGKSFRLPEVRLIQGNEQMEATNILSSATQIKCKVTI
jgi:hypothetical protein